MCDVIDAYLYTAGMATPIEFGIFRNIPDPVEPEPKQEKLEMLPVDMLSLPFIFKDTSTDTAISISDTFSQEAPTI